LASGSLILNFFWVAKGGAEISLGAAPFEPSLQWCNQPGGGQGRRGPFEGSEDTEHRRIVLFQREHCSRF